MSGSCSKRGSNHAAAVNGLLYMHGAGWTHHYRSFGPNGEPAAALIGIGLTVLLKENEGRKPHDFEVRIPGEKGQDVLQAGGQFSLDPNAALGSPGFLRTAIAVNGPVAFPAAGRYVLEARVGGARRQTRFIVVDPSQGRSGRPTGLKTRCRASRP